MIIHGSAISGIIITIGILFSICLSQPVYGPRGIAIDGVAIAASGDNVYLT
jgi:hypothetical protein